MYTVNGLTDQNALIERHASLVKRIANHILARMPSSVQLADLVQAGMLGLLDAIRRYEVQSGAQFETYASQRIRGAIMDELRQRDWLPRGTRSKLHKIDKAVASLEQRLGRAPNEAEIAAQLKIPLAEYQQMLGDAKGCQLFYLEDLRGGEESYLDRHAPDTSNDPLARLNEAGIREALAAAIEQLPEREKTVMGLYYEQELNLKEIGQVLGVTESRICQLHSQAIARLRARMRGMIR